MDQPPNVQNEARTSINMTGYRPMTIRPGSIVDRLSKRKARRLEETFERRATRCLRHLGQPDGPLRLKLAQRVLRRGYDLSEIENALRPVALQLQMRLVELVPSYPELRPFVPETRIEPVRRLFFELVAQAFNDGATRILLDFAPETGEGILVDYYIDLGWRTAMTMPPNLRPALHGYLRRVETAGYARLRELTGESKSSLPADIAVARETSDRITIDLVEAQDRGAVQDP